MDTKTVTYCHLQYDGSYEGLLSVVFECYRLKLEPEEISVEGSLTDLFSVRESIFVPTSSECAQRVTDGISRYGGHQAVVDVYKTFLSEDAHRETIIYQYLRLLFNLKTPISNYYHEDAVFRVSQLVRQMGREIHRMHAFVRFQELADGLYFAPIAPDFDVLPLTYQHFQDRYAVMEWCIYDIKRNYGMLYNGQTVEKVVLDDETLIKSIQLPQELLSGTEQDYQQLWQGYFKSTNIVERKNLKLHLRHVPTRYWKYLTEKQ